MGRLRLVSDCATCTGTFAERTAEGVLKRTTANGRGAAITPELERQATAA